MSGLWNGLHAEHPDRSLSCIRNELCRKQRGRSYRDDLIVVAVQDQGWYVELFQVFRKIGFGERL
jgi:hypothetical protein